MYEICVWSIGVLVIIGENYEYVHGDPSVPSFTTNLAWNDLGSNQWFFSEK
jgi:hypothetical protein